MHPSKRLMWLVSMAAVVALAAACGGQPAEQAPAEEPAAAAEEPAPAPAPEVAAEPEPMPEEPVAPVQQLQGSIVEIESEHDMGWTTAATREVPGKYYWVVQLRNDTTQTLDITVRFDFLDDGDNVIKTDRETVRMQPAQVGTFRVEGEMERDNARAVASYTYSWDWKIVEGN